MEICGIIVIVCAVIAGILYAQLWRENINLKAGCAQGLPLKYIMIKAESEESPVMELYNVCRNAHVAAGASIAHFDKTDTGCHIIYDNDDEIVVYQYGASVTPIGRNELGKYNLRLFFDDKLPAGAERAIIKQLGLANYMVEIGICSKEK